MSHHDAVGSAGSAEDLAALRRTIARERALRNALEAELEMQGRTLSETYRELERAYEELDGRVDERTRSLSEANRLLKSEIEERQRVERDLREERDRAAVATEGLRFALDESERLRAAAEVAARTKAEFLANMSHEIRTPMNGILGMVQLLETTALNQMQHQYLETVRTSADALLALINDILDLSKIEAGGMELEEIPFSMRETVENVGDLLATRAHQKNVDLVTRLGPGMPALLRGDPDRLRQVLVNLIGNAVKFTPAGHVLLHATCDRIVDGRAEITLEVKDTGIGIEPGKIELVFEKFTQADGSTTRLYGGTGLGLSISRDLVRMMGGTLSAESEVGVGSTFRVSLSLAVEEAAPDPAAGHRPFAGETALVLDPSPLTRCVLTESLQELGVRAEEVPSRAELEALLDTGAEPRWRWILAEAGDLEEAKAVARAVVDRYGAEAPTLIAMTRLGSGPDRAELLAVGFQGLVMRPLRPSRLPDLLEKARGGALEVPKVSARAAEVGRARSASARSPRILVAEDNAVNRRVAQGLLEKLGCRVELAEDGHAALERVRSDPPDLVFMDCQMPVMDGYEASQRIRELPGEAARVPIIAMTAHAMGGDREKCLEAGMDDYIAKPVRVAAIRDVIEKWMSAEPASA